MSDQQKIRVSLPPGTILKGRKHAYTILHTLRVSERSITAACRSEDGTSFRLKLYHDSCSITEEVLQTLCSVPVKGTVGMVDLGTYAGLLFSVSPIVKARSMDQMPISLKLLTERIIPQLAYVVRSYHQNRILLRDLCPEHILWLEQEQRIAYCGFQNAAMLPGQATVTKTPGFGQHFSYIAPEVERFGYSIHSDYFALGMTILSLVRGSGLGDSVTKEQFYQDLFEGIVQGIDTGHLKNTPPELYGAEDRVLYLAWGLLLPDPGKRWGYGEIRCWCNGQHLPLIPKEGKITYQFAEPYVVGNTKCWNVRQLAETLAAKKEAWTLSTAQTLAEFAKRQYPKCAKELASYASDPAIGPAGKVFRCIYTLCPSMDRLWWQGSSYPDMQALVLLAAQKESGRKVLEQLLREQCLSFFCKVRAEVSGDFSDKVPELMQMEQWELEKSQKGVYRCMMRFAEKAESRAFWADGKRFLSIRSLLEHYQKDPKKLKQQSGVLLSDPSFQAWIWAGGAGQAGEYAEQIIKTQPDKSFFLLLSLCEKLAQEEETKGLARGLYLHYGDLAPVVWLAEHIQEYRTSSAGHQMLFDVFAQAAFSVHDPLKLLADRARKLTADYQTFVGRTLDNPLMLEHGELDSTVYGYYPVYENGYFCCTWENGLEVCPAFLKSVGEMPDQNVVRSWLETAEKKEQERLKALLLQYPLEAAPVEVQQETMYRKLLLRNILYGAAACAGGVWLTGMGIWQIGLLLLLPGGLFLAGTFFWYRLKRERIEFWNREQSSRLEKRAEITGMMNAGSRRREEIGRSIQSGQPVMCRFFSKNGQGAGSR